MIGHTGFVLDTGLGKTHKLFLDICKCNSQKTHERERSSEIDHVYTILTIIKKPLDSITWILVLNVDGCSALVMAKYMQKCLFI